MKVVPIAAARPSNPVLSCGMVSPINRLKDSVVAGVKKLC